MNEDSLVILKKNFDRQVFDYPLKSYANQNYYRTLETKLLIFEDKIRKLPTGINLIEEIKNNLPQIELLNRRLLNSISNYLWGSQRGATEHFNLLIESSFVKSKLLNLSEPLKYDEKNTNRLFRIRNHESELNDRKELFHIPFNKRHLVANQRFSIAGLPCLYLGSSIYVCWLELQKPRFSDIYISGFKPKNSLNVLNLAFDLELIIQDLTDKKITEKQFLDRFLIWPLIMACSFQTKHSKASFHEEYIIPSLLLEWITFYNDEISGLSYLSTKLSTLRKSNYGINYVFPPQNLKDRYEFCPILSEEFSLTMPLSWDLLMLLPPPDVTIYGSGIKAENLEDALLDNYENSRFGYVEEQVFSMEFSNISKPKKLISAKRITRIKK